MSYTYVAIDSRDGSPKAAFPRKYELAQWAKVFNSADTEDVYRAYHLEFFRVRSYPSDAESTVTELTREDLGLDL